MLVAMAAVSPGGGAEDRLSAPRIAPAGAGPYRPMATPGRTANAALDAPFTPGTGRKGWGTGSKGGVFHANR